MFGFSQASDREGCRTARGDCNDDVIGIDPVFPDLAFHLLEEGRVVRRVGCAIPVMVRGAVPLAQRPLRPRHVIDVALYESAAQCVELKEPALQLMQVIEGDPDEEFIEQIIRDLTSKSLNDVASSADIQQRFQPILKLHRETMEAIKRKAIYEDGVVQFDLVEEGYEGFNKFIPYYLFPEATYTVALTRAPQRTKISVGSNPWAPRPRRHNIATICERYGGGGHAVVGAISFSPDEVEKGRAAMREIVEELQSD